MVKDVIESLRLNWISRASSPLFGALAVSWMVWNHRLLFTLFAEKPVSWRFAYIDEILYPSTLNFFVFNFLGPILSALLYLYVFPYPAKKVFEFNLKRKTELNQIAQQIEGQRLLTQEEAAVLRQRINEVEVERAKLIEASNESQQTLRSVNEGLAKRLREAEADISSAKAQAIPQRPDESIPRLQAYLLSRPFMLVFNLTAPRDKGSKRMMFGEGGAILMGGNDNENRWELHDRTTLSFINSGGARHSSFDFVPADLNFVGEALSSGMKQAMYPAKLE